jgi:predicted  nucleic acid-binding Zn-ribbon protein
MINACFAYPSHFRRSSARDHVKAELNEERSKKVLKDEHAELKKKHYTLLTRYAELVRVNSDLEASGNDLEVDHDDLESTCQPLANANKRFAAQERHLTTQLRQQQRSIAELRQQIPPSTQHFICPTPAAAPSPPASVSATPTTQEFVLFDHVDSSINKLAK